MGKCLILKMTDIPFRHPAALDFLIVSFDNSNESLLSRKVFISLEAGVCFGRIY